MAGVIPLAMECYPDGGTILEFGVGLGTSYCYLADMILAGCDCKLIGFDSFQGLPEEEGHPRHEEPPRARRGVGH